MNYGSNKHYRDDCYGYQYDCMSDYRTQQGQERRRVVFRRTFPRRNRINYYILFIREIMVKDRTGKADKTRPVHFLNQVLNFNHKRKGDNRL